MLPYTSYLDINPKDTYIIPLYSVPLIHLKLENWEEKKSILMKTYDSIFVDPNNLNLVETEDYGVVTDYHKAFVEDDFTTTEVICEHFVDELEFISGVFNTGIQIQNSWFEKSSRNKQHTPHNHGNCGLSCVVFIKFDPKYHTPTIFIDPYLASDSSIAPQNSMPPGIREGSMIVFPSYLMHYTLPNLTDVDRIILSFNLTFERECGNPFEKNNPDEGEYAIPDSSV